MKTSINNAKTTEATTTTARTNNQPAFWLNGQNKVKFGRLVIDQGWRPDYDKFTGGFMFLRQSDLTVEEAEKADKNGHKVMIVRWDDVVLGRVFECTKSKTVLAKAFKAGTVGFNKVAQVVTQSKRDAFFTIEE